jgi:hypothetical protein
VTLLELIVTTHYQNTRNQLIHVRYATDHFSMHMYLRDIFCIPVPLLALKLYHWYFIIEVDPYDCHIELCDKLLSSQTYYFKNHIQASCTVVSSP